MAPTVPFFSTRVWSLHSFYYKWLVMTSTCDGSLCTFTTTLTRHLSKSIGNGRCMTDIGGMHIVTRLDGLRAAPEDAPAASHYVISLGDRVSHRHRADNAPDKRGLVQEVSVSVQ